MSSLHAMLPPWVHRWLDRIVPAAQIALIVLAAWLLRTLLRRLVRRLSEHHALPPELTMLARRGSGFVIYSTALLLILDRLGVSGTVLWTAFTGFAAVAAVAVFGAWSVLPNIFCTRCRRDSVSADRPIDRRQAAGTAQAHVLTRH
jgi:small-conductance mechanosensitive channel